MNAKTDFDFDAAEMVLMALCPSLAEDVLQALRYFYYVKSKPLVADHIYDRSEKEFMERPDTDTFCTPLNSPGSDRAENYPDHIKALALYIGIIQAQRKG